MVSGECNCGLVAFAVDAEPTDVFVCHCSICRGYTGSNGIAVVLCENAAFRWLRGQEQIVAWKKPDANWESFFCRTCGSALPGPNDETRTFIPAGSIKQGGEKLRVAHHIFVESRAVWDKIGDDGLQHPEAFESDRAQMGDR